MKSSQLKTIAILILLALNISLLAVTIYRTAQEDLLKAQSTEEFYRLIESYGVTLDDDAISETPVSAVTYEAVTEISFRSEAAGTLIGLSPEMDQGGGIYIYETNNGLIRFRGGGYFSAQLGENYRLSLSDGETFAAHALRLMQEMGFETVDAQPSEETGSDGEIIVTLRERYNGRNIFNCEMMFLYDSIGLYAMEGRWLPPFETLTPLSEAPANTPESVLLPFITAEKASGSAMTRIELIEPGYIVLPAAPNVTYVTPVWYIKTDIGDSYINAVTGEKEFPD